MCFISSSCYHFHNVGQFHIAPGIPYLMNKPGKRKEREFHSTSSSSLSSTLSYSSSDFHSENQQQEDQSHPDPLSHLHSSSYPCKKRNVLTSTLSTSSFSSSSSSSSLASLY